MKQILKLQKKVCICKQCGKGFISPSHLRDHMDSHKEFAQMKCDACEKYFKTEKYLAQHKRRTHEKRWAYHCIICDRTFGDRKKHQLVHTQEKPYQCKTCARKFSQVGNLKRHEIIHSNDRPFKCQECSDTFKLEDSLKGHIKRIHIKEKSFVSGLSFTIYHQCGVKNSLEKYTCMFNQSYCLWWLW